MTLNNAYFRRIFNSVYAFEYGGRSVSKLHRGAVAQLGCTVYSFGYGVFLFGYGIFIRVWSFHSGMVYIASFGHGHGIASFGHGIASFGHGLFIYRCVGC